MRAYVAYWDVADGTFEHQKFLELFEDLLCQMGDRFPLNIYFFINQQHGLQSHQLELNHAVQLQLLFLAALQHSATVLLLLDHDDLLAHPTTIISEFDTLLCRILSFGGLRQRTAICDN